METPPHLIPRPPNPEPPSSFSSTEDEDAAYIPSPPLPSPILTEVGLTVDAAYRERVRLLDWLLASPIPHRSTYTLSSLQTSTLIYGLIYLRQRITELVALDRTLHNTYLTLIPDDNYFERSFAYAGWEWRPPKDRRLLERLEREQVERLLELDLRVYDAVRKSTGIWRRDIERLRGGVVHGEIFSDF